MRIGAGCVTETVECPSLGRLEVSYLRDDEGWVAELAVAGEGGSRPTVTHRLRAPSLREARQAVAPAAAYLAGAPCP